MQQANKNHFVSFWQRIYMGAQKFPNLYAAVVFAAALIGFAILLSFPLLFVTGGWKLLTYPISDPAAISFTMLVFWLVVTLLSAFISLQISKLKFQQTEGIPIDASKALKLHQLLDKVNTQFPTPRIKDIVVTEQLSIDVVKTPRYAIPVWSNNTLVIGLPLMQCLSPEYFECAVVRKLIQHSKQRHAILKWLHQLRHTWLIYSNQLKSSPSFGNFILSGFFRIYTPFYRNLSVPVANRVELIADQDSLDIINDEDLLQTIEKVIVTKIYLDRQYWPKIEKMLIDGSYKYMDPYSRLEEALKGGLTSKNAKRWLDSLYAHETSQITAIPGLRARMHNIGRNRIRIPEKVSESAASYYLHNDYFNVISSVNKLWSQRQQRLNKRKMVQGSNSIPTSTSNLASPLSFDVFQ